MVFVNMVSLLFLILTPVFAIGLTVWHLMVDGFMPQIWLLGVFLYFATGLGITVGYHRLFSHKSFEAKPWVRWTLAFFGAAAFENSILNWARDHRVHHRFVDSDQDPYSIKKGFFYAHMGWIIEDAEPIKGSEAFARDLANDPIVKFQDRYYIPIAVGVGFILPAVIGFFLGSALGGLAVAGFLRVVTVHHATFLINSLCHTLGTRPYSNQQTARDSWIVSLLTFGEGYHNYHHVFANDYRNGIKWYHFDPSKWTIRSLNWIGATYSLKRASKAEIMKARLDLEEKSFYESVSSWVPLEGLDKRVVYIKEQLLHCYERLDQIKKDLKSRKELTAHQVESLKLQLRALRQEVKRKRLEWVRLRHSYVFA